MHKTTNSMRTAGILSYRLKKALEIKWQLLRKYYENYE